MKAIPTCSRQADTLEGGKLILMPKASITSADPHCELTLRLPCLATRTPAPATTKEVAVEMLKVLLASPPVPQVSTSASRSVPLTSRVEFWITRGAAAARIASANPTISSTVSPFMCNATSNAAICASVHWPVSTSDMTALASSRESDWQWLAMRIRASVIIPLKGSIDIATGVTCSCDHLRLPYLQRFYK